MTHAGRGTGPATIHCLIDNTKLEPGSKHVSLKVEPGSEPKALQLDPRVGSRPATTPAPSPAPATASPAASWHALGTPPEELQLEFTLPTGQSFRWRRSGAGAGGAGAGGGPAEAGAEPRTGGPSTAAEDMAVAGAGGAVAPGTGGRPTRCAGLPAAAAAARAPPPRLAGKKRPLQTDVCGEHRVGGRFGGLGVVLGCVCRLGFRAA